MSLKTTLAIIITIGLTILIIQNTEEATFTILFASVILPKLVMLTAVSVSAFILGVLVSGSSSKKVRDHYDDYDDEGDDENDQPRRRPDTLSDEDREYIS
jgi:uncharacterized integral membrane protein